MNFFLSVVITFFSFLFHFSRCAVRHFVCFSFIFFFIYFCRRPFCLFALYLTVFKNIIAMKRKKKTTEAMGFFLFVRMPCPKWKLWTPNIYEKRLWPLHCAAYVLWAHLLLFLFILLGALFLFYTLLCLRYCWSLYVK